MDELNMCLKIPVGAILNVVILLVHFLWLSRLQASVIAMYSCLAIPMSTDNLMDGYM